jgi:excinuclease ABC subunit C
MPQSDEERILRLRDKIAQFPRCPGVYLMKDTAGRVLYVGKARELRARVASYFQDASDLFNTRGPLIQHMAALVQDIDFLECETEVDALLRESRLIKDIQPPYNERLKDDKTFPYLEITSEDFPGVYVTRKPRADSKLYGPFASAAGVRDAVNVLQRIFKFRTCELDIRADDDRRRFFRPCLLHSINQCTAPCADRISREAYVADIRRLRKLLNTKRSVLLRELRREMDQAAAAQAYEEAGVLRDRIQAIESLALHGDVTEDAQPEVFFVDPAAGLERLQGLLSLPERPRIVEGIDIATLHGEESVGSLVCFIDGKPFKSGYRRFRIKTVEGVDDYAMIREVIARRYKYAAAAEELYPDIILIDGGLGQLHAALEAFEYMRHAFELDSGRSGMKPAMVISLAKREELIYVQARSEPLRLPRNDAALRLVQHIRDEAHRFGQHYHHVLRRKRTFEEDVAAGRRPPRVRRDESGPRSKKRRRKEEGTYVQPDDSQLADDPQPPLE